jgi:hypothetical protein
MPHVNEGACLCTAVRFRIASPYRWFAHCHCTLCRKQYGTLFGTSLGVAEGRFRWLAGGEDLEHFRASPTFERPFCRHCGAKVPARSHEPDSWTVPAGLVHGALASRPRSHIFVAAKNSLAPISDDLPQHAFYPPGIHLPLVANSPPRHRATGLTGSCLCGVVAFESDALEPELVHCHCERCRVSSGAAFASTLAVPAAGFRWLRGAECVRTYATNEPRPYRVAFCAGCGSAAPLPSDDPSTLRLPAGSIDTALHALPALHLHVDAKAPWDEITDAWPRFMQGRGSILCS